MNPIHENVEMPDKAFPIRLSVNSSNNHHISVHPHWHEEIEILYVVAGDAIQQINEHLFHIEQGDMVVIGSNDVHATYTQREGKHDILVLQFGTGLIKPMDLVSPDKKWMDDFLCNVEFPGPIHVSENVKMVDCIYTIQRELKERGRAFEVFVKARIYELVGILTRDYTHVAKKRSDMGEMDKSREMLQNTFKLIDENYMGNLTLKQAAKASNLSVSHFCRLFKKFTGMTFKEYLTLYRVNRAEEILTTDKSITEVSYACGFNSIDSFIRAFKRYKKCTPSSYRDRVLTKIRGTVIN